MKSQDLPASIASRVSPNQKINLHKSHQPGPSKGHLNLPKTVNQLNVYAQKQEKHTVQHLHFPQIHKKVCELMSEC